MFEMPAKRKRTTQRYAVNISIKAWDLAKAGAALKLKIRDRDDLLGTIEIGQGTFGWMSARGSPPRKAGNRRLTLIGTMRPRRTTS
jgi:hypothetical protein